MQTGRLTVGQIFGRILIYAVLTGFAFVMIFPFLYMMSTSLKTSDDVFRFPPQLFPLTSETATFENEIREIYLIEVDGEIREMVTTGEKLPHIFFSTLEQINADDKRSSAVTVALPREEALDGGLAVPTGEVITVTASDGDEEEFDEYTVTVDGETFILLEAYRGSMDEFVDPQNPQIRAYAFERSAEKLEYIDFQLDNYNNVFALNLDRALINTTLVTAAVVLGQLVTSIFGGYAFSRVRFRGRDTLFLLYLGSIMVPFVVLIIPMYRLMVILEWQNKIVSLIIPWVFTAYGTFLMRQFFISIPKEIEEAALLDGASRFRILWGIFVPLSKPAIATLAIFSFLYAWNSFLWPLLIIGEGNTSNHVLTLALIRLSNSFADQPNIVLTGAAIEILPPVIIFVFAQRYFIEGVATSGLKG
jgi:ABC-type glycerol-3-phosphate transport system permease component